MSDEGTFQMLWACEYCGTQKLLALDHKHCPVCGAAQNAESRYYPDEGDEVAVADHEYAGADKVCPACETPNSGKSGFCGACGSDLEGAKDSARRGEKRTGEGEDFEGDSAKAAAKEHKDKKRAKEKARIDEMSGVAPEPKEEESTSSSKGGIVGLVVGVLVIGGILGGVIMICLVFSWLMQKDVSVTATGHSWERVVQIEEYKVVRESAWKKDVPSAARNMDCKKEQKGTKKEEDGETCETVRKDQGDGTFKKKKECKPKYKEVPVYKKKCKYDIEKWVKVRAETAKGQGTSGLKWPDTSRLRMGNCVGCKREGARTETLTVHLEDSETGDKYSANCDKESDWKAAKVGTQYEATGSRGSSQVNCATLKIKK